MPNHVKNRLTLSGDPSRIYELVTKFTKHYPAELRKTENHFGDSDFKALIICKDHNGHGWFDPSTGIYKTREAEVLGLPEGAELLVDRCQYRFPDFDAVVPMPEDIKSTFHQSGLNPPWYNWSLENWGTKWNSYEHKRLGWNVFEFETAWSNVAKVIDKMHEQFKDVEILYEWADEDTGNNTGFVVFKDGVGNGTVLKNGSIEAYEMAFKLSPEYMDNYELIDGEYVWKDED